MELPQCLTVYPGDGVTSHEQLILFLKYQQSQIDDLKAQLRQLKKPPSWAPRRGALYGAGAHLKPPSESD
jgi:hypothetical protein